jgi:ribosome-associated toxin RatA of RatAB toxin-antitoxin module
MDVHFNATRSVAAPAAVLFEVITDYPSYPRFNPAVTNVRVVRKDDTGAEFVAERKTAISKRARAYDRYERRRDVVLERTYEGSPSARSTWTIHPVDGERSTLTIDASQRMGPLRGAVMWPLLRRTFYRLNFTPFIAEAERRAGVAAAA